MFKKSLSDIPSFIAGDKTIIKEFVHPKNDAVDVHYSLAHAVVEVGKASEPHILTKSSELYVILSGEGELFIENESAILRGGRNGSCSCGCDAMDSECWRCAFGFLCDCVAAVG